MFAIFNIVRTGKSWPHTFEPARTKDNILFRRSRNITSSGYTAEREERTPGNDERTKEEKKTKEKYQDRYSTRKKEQRHRMGKGQAGRGTGCARRAEGGRRRAEGGWGEEGERREGGRRELSEGDRWALSPRGVGAPAEAAPGGRGTGSWEGGSGRKARKRKGAAHRRTPGCTLKKRTMAKRFLLIFTERHSRKS